MNVTAPHTRLVTGPECTKDRSSSLRVLRVGSGLMMPFISNHQHRDAADACNLCKALWVMSELYLSCCSIVKKPESSLFPEEVFLDQISGGQRRSVRSVRSDPCVFASDAS